MTKEEAIERLIQLRWALDSLPDEANILNMIARNEEGQAYIHTDRASVNADLSEVRTKRQDMDTLRRSRHIGNVEVFCLIQSPVPEGV